MHLHVGHTTQFLYNKAPAYGLLQLRMVPQSSRAQSVLNWEINLKGGQLQTTFMDHHGNQMHLIEIMPNTRCLEISVNGEVDTYLSDGVLGQHKQAMPVAFYRRQTNLTQITPELLELAESITLERGNAITDLHALSQVIRGRIPYCMGKTSPTTTAGEALKSGEGVCQDHSHVFISIARQKGLPARYVSGYLLMEDRVHQDASHAWAEVYLDSLGWVSFDVSNGISPDERYIRIAQGLDYSDAAPTKGITLGEVDENLVVSVQVQQ